jgi:hypothetical protein
MDQDRSQPGFPVGRTASRTASTKQLAASGLSSADLDPALDALAALIEPV